MLCAWQSHFAVRTIVSKLVYMPLETFYFKAKGGFLFVHTELCRLFEMQLVRFDNNSIPRRLQKKMRSFHTESRHVVTSKPINSVNH